MCMCDNLFSRQRVVKMTNKNELRYLVCACVLGIFQSHCIADSSFQITLTTAGLDPTNVADFVCY